MSSEEQTSDYALPISIMESGKDGLIRKYRRCIRKYGAIWLSDSSYDGFSASGTYELIYRFSGNLA